MGILLGPFGLPRAYGVSFCKTFISSISLFLELLSLRSIYSISNLKAYLFDHMRKLWSRGQFEYRLIVLPFTLLTIRDVSSETLPPAAVTQLNNYC